MFKVYGEDKTGRLPYELFVNMFLESPSRLMGLEERRMGPFDPREDLSFRQGFETP